MLARIIACGLVFALVVAGCTAGPMRPGALEVRDLGGGAVDRFVDFSRGGEERVAQVLVRTVVWTDDLVRLWVHIPHPQTDSYKLEAVTLEFAPRTGTGRVPLTQEVSTYAWSYQFRDTGEVVRLHIPDTGDQGRGTVDLGFFVPRDFLDDRGVRLRAEIVTNAGKGVAVFEDIGLPGEK